MVRLWEQGIGSQMYKKLGFVIVDENEEKYIMLCELQGGIET